MMSLPSERDCPVFDDEKLVEIGRQVLLEEAEEIKKAAFRIGPELAKAARIVQGCRGRLVISGLGKSGHIGRKIAATLASLGTPSFFLHAAEAAHGDLGMVRREDVAFLISHSGTTSEVVKLIPFFRRLGAPVIALTGSLESPLAKGADVVLNASVEREADPLNLAPTSSTTVQLAIGDALAGVVTEMRCLRKEDFALFHPAGALGRQLLLKVSDVMGSGPKLPVVKADVAVKEALFEITSKNYGATTVVDDQGTLVGVFTDGDLRRLIERQGVSALEENISDVMTEGPRTIGPDHLAVEAVRIMQDVEVSVLIITDEDRPVGMVHLHELLQAGLS
ncbi:KpsF/GutQ family sugar-phosphate isomerase [Dethiosulfovibrio sp. F2B]|uniref:KpsF/GutQ family sugar-phosphate isomerase n=1 Tax=Dethiosulfovibrio faecalis TaxID=2720018 RepID=UPI001F2E47BE|nr:KpsF/GutQ family sugar-phosphate isomerase [Dethiosulfovibrio faecalis]MCF4150664.1 KpsF/GutQ family sugar-phosphate isomerase [Dethiosulfovibrio faecalis]